MKKTPFYNYLKKILLNNQINDALYNLNNFDLLEYNKFL